jgi:LysR family transcriptional regulator, transcriptional activator of nhaA
VSSLNFHHLRYFWVVAREGSVSRAARKLGITQPTISGQLAELADQLGEPLFRREGRNLALTEVGEAIARIADEIFALGEQVVEVARGKVSDRPLRLVIGISDSVPKYVAHRILEPAFEARVQVTCREGPPAELLAELKRHAIDVVIADAPSHGHGTHDHLLGECGMAVWGSRRLAGELRVGFPRSLDGAPFLLPSTNTGFRRELDAWFVARKITPRVVGEFDDDALLTVAAESGAGLYAAPDALAHARRPRGVVRAGSIKSLRARYYAITVERKLVHPAVSLVAGAARATLFPR